MPPKQEVRPACGPIRVRASKKGQEEKAGTIAPAPQLSKGLAEQRGGLVKALYGLTRGPVVLALVWMVAACGGTPSVPVKQSPILGPYSYTPPASHLISGTVIFSDSHFPDSVNPLFASSNVDFEVNAALWAQPVFYDQRFHVHADQLTEVPLPENGDVRDGGKTIVMHLRPFHRCLAYETPIWSLFVLPALCRSTTCMG